MPTLSRRRFLATLAAAFPLAVVVRRAHAAAVITLERDPATLDALAETVLPSELGSAGIEAAAAAFLDWGANYHEGAELVHGYGTSRLTFSGPTPLTRWTAHLDELDSAARGKFQRSFRDLNAGQREGLVRAGIAGAAADRGGRLDRMPAVASANHVAVALIAHFYQSSAATDLCYRAHIGKATCRPLAAQAKRPLPVLTVGDR